MGFLILELPVLILETLLYYVYPWIFIWFVVIICSGLYSLLCLGFFDFELPVLIFCLWYRYWYEWISYLYFDNVSFVSYVPCDCSWFDLDFFCFDMNVFQILVLHIALQLLTIGSDYVKCALLSRMHETCISDNQV